VQHRSRAFALLAWDVAILEGFSPSMASVARQLEVDSRRVFLHADLALVVDNAHAQIARLGRAGSDTVRREG